MRAPRPLRNGGLRWAVVTVTLLATLALAATLAGAAPVPGTPEVPRIAIVATSGNFPDSLVAGPIAGALGGIVVLTPGDSLASEAEDTLVAFDPDIVYIAGGTAAISADVEAAVAAAGAWTVERKSGPTRIQTAAALNTIFDDLDVGRPALVADGQVIGDAAIGGTLSLDGLMVHGDAPGLAVAGAVVDDDTSIRSWFNRVGGEPTVTNPAEGDYRVTFEGRSFNSSNSVAVATLVGVAGFATVDWVGGTIHIRTFDGMGPDDRTFSLAVFDATSG